MNIRIGVVGPEDSVQSMLKELEPYEDFQAVPLTYEQTSEIKEIVPENQHKVDFWFFSGQSPYDVAVSNQLVSEKDASFPPLYGASLLGRLLEAQYKENQLLLHISLDTIQENEIKEIREEFLGEDIEIFNLSYKGYISPDKIVSFHEDLYNEGKIEAVFTSIREVYLAMKEKNIPCYRVRPTKLSIQLTLKYVKERAQSMLYRKSQIAIVAIEVAKDQKALQEESYSFKRKHRELDLHRWLLYYAEKARGSYVQMGDGLYFIYTTRGEIELESEQLWFQFVEDARVNTALEVRTVIGYGRTTLESEENARRALQEAREAKTNSIIIVDEDLRITEHKSAIGSFTYEQRNMHRGEEKGTESSLSPAFLSKLHSLSRYYSQDIVTAQDIARWLNSSLRNARRILLKLEENQIAVQTGEEQSGHRGRPRRVYRLQFREQQ
ncbi:hypothetical protein [Marinococcus sp. PL1-022]|uniref:hypothetical protein n=1 Tax=Marinococcus sp. PL1-022 TaxID=3095363 RepID=UPI0029C3B8E3|nr:hypothetical protein [Marinococcus sp. PL1-022]MDX6151893.1 hypothetical protein [Marinococcus sp. PL1-022]